MKTLYRQHQIENKYLYENLHDNTRARYISDRYDRDRGGKAIVNAECESYSWRVLTNCKSTLIQLPYILTNQPSNSIEAFAIALALMILDHYYYIRLT